MDMREITRWIFDPWVILGAIAFGFLVLFAGLALLFVTRPVATMPDPATAVVTVISLPTATNIPPTATLPGPETPTPSRTSPEAAVPPWQPGHAPACDRRSRRPGG